MNSILLYHPDWLTEQYWAGNVYLIVDQQGNVWVADKDMQL